ncbi:hypothetical protein H7J88_04590 [Mycolicibacterium flavescens]|uniref:Secreted protein n=1 Tax=Mycolicibacterium flavescens TaxID=1776 RepID=A0A1E3RKM6_MYCFV|nr:hypothetical protein [Mycolicibacterium flavescens]MCV7278921.1 hypothetical protein [Mycolicibacterium flavescens]ODQ90433.1 hypothetical protein BHQ18_10295 [Mycolicibacterium flavescens]
MVKLFAIAAASAALTFIGVPSASAQPDPKVPNGAANWCPGGQKSGQGGQRYCLGEPFPDGSFYSQTWSFGPGGPFAPGAWHNTASCSVLINGSIQGGLPYGGIPQCGGGPRAIHF